MTSWADVQAAAPELTSVCAECFERTGLILLGSLRSDGSPRISPVEVLIVDSELSLGMMWRSMKALDLLRDPRCVVHSAVCDKNGSEGEVKAYGVARSVDDEQQRERYCVALFAATGWRPDGPFHLFTIEIDQVSYVRFGEGQQVTRCWRPGDGEPEILRRPA